jgi:nucleoside-diphosphate-sugar epimerase
LAGSFSGVKITQYLQSNVISSLNLIESVTTIKNYHPHILLIGSASEYGQTLEKFLPTKETFEGQPLNGYGWSNS